MSETNLPNRWRGRINAYAPLLLWIGLIFFLSSGQGAMSQTSRFVRPLLELLFPAASEELLQIYHTFIRKFAHFFEYAVLAFWAWRALAKSAIVFLSRYQFILPLVLVLLIALLDEINQSFNSDRTSSGYDVLLDFVGGATVILIIYLTAKYMRKEK